MEGSRAGVDRGGWRGFTRRRGDAEVGKKRELGLEPGPGLGGYSGVRAGVARDGA